MVLWFTEHIVSDHPYDVTLHWTRHTWPTGDVNGPQVGETDQDLYKNFKAVVSERSPRRSLTWPITRWNRSGNRNLPPTTWKRTVSARQSLTPYTPVNLPQPLTLCTRVSNPSDHKEVTVVINPLHSYLAPKWTH
jgi:hypothetical protein